VLVEHSLCFHFFRSYVPAVFYSRTICGTCFRVQTFRFLPRFGLLQLHDSQHFVQRSHVFQTMVVDTRALGHLAAKSAVVASTIDFEIKRALEGTPAKRQEESVAWHPFLSSK